MNGVRVSENYEFRKDILEESDDISTLKTTNVILLEISKNLAYIADELKALRSKK